MDYCDNGAYNGKTKVLGDLGNENPSTAYSHATSCDFSPALL